MYKFKLLILLFLLPLISNCDELVYLFYDEPSNKIVNHKNRRLEIHRSDRDPIQVEGTTADDATTTTLDGNLDAASACAALDSEGVWTDAIGEEGTDDYVPGSCTAPANIDDDIVSKSIDTNYVIGYWIYDKDLFYNEMKRLNIPKIDMSVYFNRVEMEFNSDSTFVSYLDDQVTYGYWDINDSLGMKPSNNIWKYYNYQLTDTSLYIYDGDYILTFKRQKETNND